MIRAGFAGVLLWGLTVAASPAFAEEPLPQQRGEAFVKLPYWPGYWVGEDQAGTPISGIADRVRGAPPPQANDSLAVWGNRAPWNEEGRRRIAEVHGHTRRSVQRRLLR